MTKFENRKAQGGFTLLEMLVTVGIMAAVAGTATLALQDTTARASAAAHVAMMDELNEGIMTYRALPSNNNSYPNNFDSLMQVAAGAAASTAVPLAGDVLGVDVGPGGLTTFTLTADMADAAAGEDGIIDAGGLTHLRYVDLGLNPADDGTCADVPGLIASRGNAVVPGNIFMGEKANGCGVSHELTSGVPVMIWGGGNERVLGAAAIGNEPAFDTTTGAFDLANSDVGAKILMVVGAGPSSTLFDASTLGGMTSVPVYRHVSNVQYNRFLVLFHIADVIDDPTNPGTNIIQAAGQMVIAGVVDGAGDTKEEELGEWDGTRNTI